MEHEDQVINETKAKNKKIDGIAEIIFIWILMIVLGSITGIWIKFFLFGWILK